MPITEFQSKILRTLAAQRSPDSYIAGGIAINRAGPRISNDIDIFHDSEDRLENAAQADASCLEASGYSLAWRRVHAGKREAVVSLGSETMLLEWSVDAAFRFFPTAPDALFGYVLHPVDLATNKASAAADRRVPRDIVDLLTIHDSVLPLGAVICAAVGKFPGVTPEEMLAEIIRHSRFTAEEFQSLATDRPIDIRALHCRIRGMIEDARGFIGQLPSEAVGVVFMDGETPVQPDIVSLEKYRQNPGAPRGFWPSAPDLSMEMLKRYETPSGDCVPARSWPHSKT